MKPGEPLRLKYISPGPVADQFLLSESFVAGIRGPIGSGKSTACVMKLLGIAARQPVAPDGRRHSRFAIIRNTYPELKTTTIKTWHQWVPPGQIGQWQNEGPPTHHILTDTLAMEVMFVALDRPEDVRKLLSMELTAAWINEAREVPKAILDGLTGRVGRFPPVRDGGCAGPQILMDTNSPDADHWWYLIAERDTTTKKGAELLQSILEAEVALRTEGALGANQQLFEFFAQPSGLSPDAENIPNLPAGYYQRAMAGKTDEWIKVYVRGEYGFVMDGRPVFPEYRDSLHCKSFELNPRLELIAGVDFGLTPAGAIGQRGIMGQWRWRYEITTEHMGARRFGELFNRFVNEKLPGWKFASITGDPAGMAESQADESTPFAILKAVGVKAQPAHTNDPTIRREAMALPMTRIIDGEPGLLVHPDCKMLRKGLAGGYHYKRVQVLGDERYRDQPDKNLYSHIVEAAEYGMLGAGEGKALVRPKRDVVRAKYATM